MNKLYHGSKFQQEELKPGLQHSGELTEWDKTESNAYLYATNDREEAIRQGIASTLEKEFDIARFEITATHFDVLYAAGAKRRPTADKVEALTIYLYTIAHTSNDGWFEVNNPHNGLMGKEYKTVRTMKDQIVKRETITVKDWLESKRVDLRVSPCIDEPSMEQHHPANSWLKW